MAIDIAITFTPVHISPEQIQRRLCSYLSQAHAVYLIEGVASANWGGKPFFALWSDGELELHRLCEALSREASPICMSWKAEHGGVGGYCIFVDGQCIAEVNELGDTYLSLPSRGIEQAFDIQLAAPPDAAERFQFPEIVLEEELVCYLLSSAGNSIKRVDNAIILQLLEDDIDGIEHVLP